MIIDAHVHCSGAEQSGEVLRALDEARIDIAVLLAPFLSDGYSLDDADSLRRANRHLARLVQGARRATPMEHAALAGRRRATPGRPGRAARLTLPRHWCRRA